MTHVSLKFMLFAAFSFASPHFTTLLAAENTAPEKLPFANEELPRTAQESVAETTVDQLAANILDGGSELKFKYRITGRVKIGANHCHAEGVTAYFTTTIDNGILSVTPFIRLPETAFDRICSGRSEPVYTQISTEVHGERHKTAGIILRNVESFTVNLPLEMLLIQANTTTLIVQQGKVERKFLSEVNDNFSLTLKLRVSVPQDFCKANSEIIRAEQIIDQRELKIRVSRLAQNSMSQDVGENELDCNSVFAGQANFTLKITGQPSQIDDILIENVQHLGTMVSLAEYLKPTVE